MTDSKLYGGMTTDQPSQDEVEVVARAAQASRFTVAHAPMDTLRAFVREGQALAFKPDGLQDALEFRTFGYDLIMAMSDEIDRLRSTGGGGWRPIETAQKDGTRMRLWVAWRDTPQEEVGRYDPVLKRWAIREDTFSPRYPADDVVTHWVPLLAPPPSSGLATPVVRSPKGDPDKKESETEILRGLVYALSDALTDEGPDWSDIGLNNLRCRVARALPDVEWLQPYLREPASITLPKDKDHG